MCHLLMNNVTGWIRGRKPYPNGKAQSTTSTWRMSSMFYIREPEKLYTMDDCIHTKTRKFNNLNLGTWWDGWNSVTGSMHISTCITAVHSVVKCSYNQQQQELPLVGSWRSMSQKFPPFFNLRRHCLYLTIPISHTDSYSAFELLWTKQ